MFPLLTGRGTVEGTVPPDVSHAAPFPVKLAYLAIILPVDVIVVLHHK